MNDFHAQPSVSCETRTHIRVFLMVALGFAVACPARADIIVFGEDINSTATGNNENAMRIPHPNSDAAQAGFLALLEDVGTETFEGFPANSTVTSIDFGMDNATLSPGLTVLNRPTGTFNGVYPISGNQTLLQSTSAANTFRIDFGSPQAAFGFYMTDVEVPGNLVLRFHLVDGVSTIDRAVPTLAGANAANNTGSVAYYGVIDTTNPFVGVSFIRSLNSNDGFGFDDMTIAREENVAPEPSTIADSYVNHSSYSGTGSSTDTSKTLVKEGTEPQLLTYNNLINTAQGLNGIVFDIENLPDGGNLSLEDFEFQMSPQGAFDAGANSPANWQSAPAPSSITVTPGSPDRVLIQWPDQSIMNRWLRITVLANEETGLAEPEVYYIGHLLGETTGPTGSTFTVSFADITPIRSVVGSTVNASSTVDIDKNGTVAFADISAMRPNVGAQLTIITIPASSSSSGQMLMSEGAENDRPMHGDLRTGFFDLPLQQMILVPEIPRSDISRPRADLIDTVWRELSIVGVDRARNSGICQARGWLGVTAIDSFYRSMADESDTSSDSDANNLLNSLLEFGNLAVENGE